ncbi:hypothetical protein CHS0354_042469 [Potamilus streckersoni]|uniref:NACHT domain-containing protein n=1 Tax=Potamilus streckersoni TaxID=2493646 RepID=A0AAE0VSS1_9BIVA|nr:hypothetical protein CHS0354_042469 [Potamilus streckersoni]
MSSEEEEEHSWYRRREYSKDAKDLQKLKAALIECYRVKDKFSLLPNNEGEGIPLGIGYFDQYIEIEPEDRRPYGARFNGVKPSRMKFQSFRKLFIGKETPRRILLQAEVGRGKTLFCKHITQVWCNVHEALSKNQENSDKEAAIGSPLDGIDEEIFSNFHILIYFDLVGTTQSSLMDLAWHQLQGVWPYISRQRFERLVNEYDQYTLFIIDSLDAHFETPSAVAKTLRRQILPLSTFIITARSWKISQLHLNPISNVDVWLELEGFAKGNNMKFARLVLEKLFSDGDAVLKFEAAVHENMYAFNFIHIPLFLLFLVHYWYTNKGFPKRSEELLIAILDFLVHRHHLKHVGNKKNGNSRFWPLEEENVVLPSQVKNCALVKMYGEGYLLSLSDIAIKFLVNDQCPHYLEFELDTLVKELGKDGKEKLQLACELGILALAESFSVLTRKVWISFPHRSMYEFLAAIRLSSGRHLTQQLYLDQLKNAKDVLRYQGFIPLLASVYPSFCEKVLEQVYTACSMDEDLHPYRFPNCEEKNRTMVECLNRMYVNCVKEAGIKSLKFQLHDLYAEDDSSFNLLLSGIQNFEKVKTLNLDKIDIMFPGHHHLFDISSSSLTNLCLSNISLGDALIDLRNSPNMNNLHLQSFTLSRESTEQLCRFPARCPYLKSLVLAYIDLGESVLNVSPMVNLVDFKLIQVTVSPACARSICTNIVFCSGIETLVIRNVNLHNGILPLGNFVHLTVLELLNVTMSQLCEEQLFRNFRNGTSLYSIHIVGQDLIHSPIDLNRLRNIVILYFDSVLISREGSALFCSSISKCRMLRTLNLLHLQLQDGILDVVEVLSLHDITLVNVVMSKKSWSAFYKSLHQLRESLSKLDNKRLELMEMEDKNFVNVSIL